MRKTLKLTKGRLRSCLFCFRLNLRLFFADYIGNLRRFCPSAQFPRLFDLASAQKMWNVDNRGSESSAVNRQQMPETSVASVTRLKDGRGGTAARRIEKVLSVDNSSK